MAILPAKPKVLDLPEPEILAKAYHDPILWGSIFFDNTVSRVVKGVLESYDPGYTPDQHRLGRALCQHNRIVVPSANNQGKSRFAALATHWFMQTRSPAKVITTGPSFSQVKDVLWSEIRGLADSARYPLAGRALPENPFWRMPKNDNRAYHGAFGKSFAKGISVRDLNAISGYHSPNLLVIIDEAAGVDDRIWIALQGLASGQDDKIFAIGNPFDPSGPFYDAWVSENWFGLSLSALNHPNVILDEKIFPGMSSRAWVEAMKIEWAERPWLYAARVLGEFPQQGTNSVIADSWVTAAMSPTAKVRKARESERPIVACDVADGGEAETVISVWWGNTLSCVKTVMASDPNATAGVLAKFGKALSPTPIFVVDAVGVGAGVAPRLRELGFRALAYKGSHSPKDEDLYRNQRAEDWWTLGEALREREVKFVQDRRLRSQLIAPQWKFDSAGRIQMETKEDMAKRGVPSPDRADSVVMAYWGHLTHIRTLARRRFKAEDEDGRDADNWADKMYEIHKRKGMPRRAERTARRHHKDLSRLMRS